MSYRDETIEIAQKRSAEIAQNFVTEVTRLLNSGMVDADDHHRGLLFGVALENLGMRYIGNLDRNDKRQYNNMKRI